MADPVSPAAGWMIDKARWDAEVYQRWTDLLSPWTAYSPGWGGTIGSGTLTGRYKRLGSLVVAQIRLVWGTGTVGPGGRWLFLLPSPARRAPVLGWGYAINIPVVANGDSQTAPNFVYLRRHNNQDVSNTVPSAWGSGNSLTVQLMYETTSAV